jgi:hypothetical protein
MRLAPGTTIPPLGIADVDLKVQWPPESVAKIWVELDGESTEAEWRPSDEGSFTGTAIRASIPAGRRMAIRVARVQP